MLLFWAGLFFILIGLAAIAIDRRAVHVFYDHVSLSFHTFLNKTTHLAKAAHWLALSVVVAAVTGVMLHGGNTSPLIHTAFEASVAFILALGLGTIIIHTCKFFLGRRRPRDELEMGLYGFIPFGFKLKHNSFPSGHALTIFCVAVVATALFPQGAVVWFALAFWLAITRALLTAHFLSDVFVGAGIGLLCARTVLIYGFPNLALSWF
ncbi:hypothetical protein FHS83_002624 [Rhizomicrobium palustre]|uniref:Phosphatidic acid phosphatase type 2/haloperoxidase domain-containing protein n=1 Tax=Rhizomicrobium palustre TaxID=189966 RepID=A0A846N0S9_9PROT|nr:phosphatase PAP2 family protein [Rhizomicrobium palustre]NIK89306.1 hypothetical protein [Rhizomicrobium palustre]